MQKSFSRNWRENILERYRIKINPRAIRELDRIYEYIANEKQAPQNALGQVNRIKNAILSLQIFLEELVNLQDMYILQQEIMQEIF